VKGVLSEGDRKAAPSPGAAKLAAPPLKEPMGKTLFGAFCATLEGGGSDLKAKPQPSRQRLDRLYAPVKSYAQELTARAASEKRKGALAAR
jgi:hypothetical protein